MQRNFNIWVLVVLLQILVMAIAGYFGFFNLLYLNDATFIGFMIIFMWAVSTYFTGRNAYRCENAKEWQWDMKENFLSLGMLGTVIGLIIVFKDFFILDLTNVDDAKKIILSMGLGIATALYTTLVGLICSLFLKWQLVILDHE